MSKVEFTYVKGGKKVLMARRYADTLSQLGHGSYEDKMLTGGKPVAPAVDDEPLMSEAVAEFAKEHGVDIEKVVGTGKDGRIKKSDVEAIIAAQDLA